MQAFIADYSTSSVDWGNKDSIIVYFAGCDFRCPYCFAAEILDTKQEFLKAVKEACNLVLAYPQLIPEYGRMVYRNIPNFVNN